MSPLRSWLPRLREEAEVIGADCERSAQCRAEEARLKRELKVYATTPGAAALLRSQQRRRRAETPGQGGGEVDLILAFAESVPFIRIIMSFDRLAGVLQHFDHLLRFFFRHSDIVFTLGN